MPESKTIEQALAMYKETVSPSKVHLQAILSHIPEQTKLEGRRAIRSPYRWLVTSQLVSVFLLVFVFIPAYQSYEAERNDPDYYFRQIDREVDAFERRMILEDYNDTFIN